VCSVYRGNPLCYQPIPYCIQGPSKVHIGPLISSNPIVFLSIGRTPRAFGPTYATSTFRFATYTTYTFSPRDVAFLPF